MARLLASLASYLVTADDDGVQLHQYAPMTVEAAWMRLTVDTDYPDGGSVLVTVEEAPAEPRTLTLRVPAWAGVNPADTTEHSTERVFKTGDQVRLDLPMKPRWTFPDRRVDATRGCAAVEVGPRS